MNYLFLRVYGGLVVAVVVVCVSVVLLFAGINHIRQEHYQTDLLTPLLQWLAADASLADSATLATFESDDYMLRRVPQSELGLSAVDRQRLAFGQVVVASPGADATLAWVALPDGKEVLEAKLADLRSAWTGLNGAILARYLTPLMADKRPLVLADLNQRLGVAASIVAAPDANQDAAQIGRSRLLPLSQQQSLRVPAPEPFVAWSWPVVLLLVTAVTLALALVVYWLLSSIDQRLRQLETVASRLARGELDARISAPRLDAVGRLGTAFNSMAGHIQRLVNVQREMIHAVSHELRTPVARIRFGVQMLEDLSSQDAMQQQLKGIDNDIQELDELIDEILTYARLEQGGPILDFQDTPLWNIVQQVVNEQSLESAVTINALRTPTSDQWGHSDVEPRYLHRCVQNLVGNAKRYAKSQVRICCQFDEETCRIDVEDDGPGIPEDDWEKVFTPFARLDDSRTRSSGGYGLGLSIVRRILYWHGGTALVSTSDLGGAKFSLIWPRRQT